MMKKFIDRQLLIYLTIFYTITVLIGLARKVYWKLNAMFGYEDITWFSLVTYNVFLDWIIVIFFMILAAYVTQKMFEKNLNWKIITLIHLFFSFFIGYFIFFLSALLVAIFDSNFDYDIIWKNMSFSHFMSVILLNFLAYFSMIGIVTVYYYIKKVKNIELQKSKLESQLANAKLNTLKSQLHPHFMFNTLNSVSSLIEVDTEKAQNLIADFGDLFRSVLESNNASKIRLKEELLLLNKYIDIVSVRFSDHLIVNKHIDVDNHPIYVPSMLIQPILENAIKHAYSYNNTELEINLFVNSDQNYVHIKVENNGKLLSEKFEKLMEKGTGLKNTYERLKTIYTKDFEFRLENKKDASGVVAYIKIPKTEFPES